MGTEHGASRLPVIGVAGLGRVGASLASRWRAAEHQVIGFDLDPVSALAMASQGIGLCVAPDELRRASIVVLTAEIEVDTFLNGVRGILADGLGDVLIVDLAPPVPLRTRERAARVARAGGRFVDACWTGDDEVVLAGAVPEVSEAMAALAAAGIRSSRVGGVGAAHAFGLIETALDSGWKALVSEISQLAVAADLAGGILARLIAAERRAEDDVDIAGLGAARRFADAVGVAVPITSAAVEARRWADQRFLVS